MSLEKCLLSYIFSLYPYYILYSLTFTGDSLLPLIANPRIPALNQIQLLLTQIPRIGSNVDTIRSRTQEFITCCFPSNLSSRQEEDLKKTRVLSHSAHSVEAQKSTDSVPIPLCSRMEINSGRSFGHGECWRTKGELADKRQQDQGNPVQHENALYESKSPP